MQCFPNDCAHYYLNIRTVCVGTAAMIWACDVGHDGLAAPIILWFVLVPMKEEEK